MNSKVELTSESLLSDIYSFNDYYKIKQLYKLT